MYSFNIKKNIYNLLSSLIIFIVFCYFVQTSSFANELFDRAKYIDQKKNEIYLFYISLNTYLNYFLYFLYAISSFYLIFLITKNKEIISFLLNLIKNKSYEKKIKLLNGKILSLENLCKSTDDELKNLKSNYKKISNEKNFDSNLSNDVINESRSFISKASSKDGRTTKKVMIAIVFVGLIVLLLVGVLFFNESESDKRDKWIKKNFGSEKNYERWRSWQMDPRNPGNQEIPQERYRMMREGR